MLALNQGSITLAVTFANFSRFKKEVFFCGNEIYFVTHIIFNLMWPMAGIKTYLRKFYY